MKTTHYTLLILLFVFIVGCDKLEFPDDSKEKTENEDVSGTDDDDDDDDDDDNPSGEQPDSGFYHGYTTASKYISAHNNKDNPIPFEDILSGGCVYSDVLGGKNSSQWNSRTCFFKGYIVGYIFGTEMTDIHFTSTNALSSNIILAPSPYTTNPDSCVPICLTGTKKAHKEARTAINLKDHPDYLHLEILVRGLVQKYMGVAGIKDVDGYEVYTNE